MKVCREDGSHKTNRYAEDSRKGGFKGTKSQKGKEDGRVGGWEQQQEEEMKSGEEACSYTSTVFILCEHQRAEVESR